MQSQAKRNGSLGTIPETTFTPPSRSNSLRVGSISRPRLKVQIPDESDAGSATNDSGSPRGTTATASDATSQNSRRLDSHSSGVVLPPPSPSTTQPPISAGARSAGATGPPNPFARPHPHQGSNMKIDTPVSALPSRFMGDAYLPSPNGFYSDLYAKVNDNNTLSPLNFGTPVVGTGPSFLRDDPLMHKRKSPEISGNGGERDPLDTLANEAKRVKVDH
jgi:MADS-box transcription factor